MAKSENKQDGSVFNAVEEVANYLNCRTKREEMSVNNTRVLDYWLGVMAEDPKFAAKVNARRSQLSPERKMSLFTKEELKKASRHHVSEGGGDEPARQPRLWKDPPVKPKGRVYAHDEIISSDVRLEKIQRQVNQPYPLPKNSPQIEEDKYLQQELRKQKKSLEKRLNLPEIPILRKDDPRRKNPTYIFNSWLNDKIAMCDNFGVFNQFQREYYQAYNNGEPFHESVGLLSKINVIGNFISNLQTSGLTDWNKRRELGKFVEEYKERYF